MKTPVAAVAAVHPLALLAHPRAHLALARHPTVPLGHAHLVAPDQAAVAEEAEEEQNVAYKATVQSANQSSAVH